MASARLSAGSVPVDDGGEVVLGDLEVEGLVGGAGREGVEVLVQEVEASDGDVELAEGDELRHVLRADHLDLEARRSPRTGGGRTSSPRSRRRRCRPWQRAVDVALLVAVRERQTEGRTPARPAGARRPVAAEIGERQMEVAVGGCRARRPAMRREHGDEVFGGERGGVGDQPGRVVEQLAAPARCRAPRTASHRPRRRSRGRRLRAGRLRRRRRRPGPGSAAAGRPGRTPRRCSDIRWRCGPPGAGRVRGARPSPATPPRRRSRRRARGRRGGPAVAGGSARCISVTQARLVMPMS